MKYRDFPSCKRTQWEVYTEFFRAAYGPLLFYASRLLDRQQAEDVVQDAFLYLWEHMEEIDGEHLRAFMYRAVYTRALNRLKHEAVVNKYNDAVKELQLRRVAYLSSDNNEVMRQMENDELRIEIERAVNSLPEKCREVFKLSYLYGLKSGQIADSLSISIRTVESHMYNALKWLRNRLRHLNVPGEGATAIRPTGSNKQE
ncbi:MAG: RNA polymerase sigma-70 factor [Rikenellaceae bacterium]|jgi:RNA polymerase sigma-70 factor (ECF subfamily)|nr:RNA polymerase sigma-70 factor [Rikenellaceae bacterium]